MNLNMILLLIGAVLIFFPNILHPTADPAAAGALAGIDLPTILKWLPWILLGVLIAMPSFRATFFGWVDKILHPTPAPAVTAADVAAELAKLNAKG